MEKNNPSVLKEVATEGQMTVLCYIINDREEVLLIKKKTGLGAGKYNGPGGKIELGETPEEASIREVAEETGLAVSYLEPRGSIEFVTEGLGFDGRCQIFVSKKFSGEPKETEEARPHWVEIKKLPCPNMWETDRYFIREVLAGGRVGKRFYFNKDCQVYKMENI